MKWPHWLRHHWSTWQPLDIARHHHGGIFLPDYSGPYDQRTCDRCGRRQRRSL